MRRPIDGSKFSSRRTKADAMIKAFRRLLLGACTAAFASVSLVCLATAPAQGGEPELSDDLPPYKMIRSLQHVQDAIVHGDLSSADMQQFMLGAIERRLMTVDRSVFNDPRNVDAALIYAMSGGNPKTLAYLVSRDIEGNFDNRVTDSLTHYLNGKGALVVEMLSKMVAEYKNKPIGPYLYLIYGNSIAQQDRRKAIEAYDWARLVSPGTNVEEAALRRSIVLATRGGKTDDALRYALSYTRRFMSSPYAGQFADIFVELAVVTFGDANNQKIEEILSFLDRPRRREVYLRVARSAAIQGMQSLTKLASERAASLSEPGDQDPNALATLYSGLVNVPSTGILEAVKEIGAIPDAQLSPRDRRLRDAAEAVAREVLRAPVPAVVAPVEEVAARDAERPAQASAVPMAPQALSPEALSGSGSSDSPFAAPAAAPPAKGTGQPESAAMDPAIATFLTTGKSKLGEIDALLQEEKP
jgi:chemotaxis protein MotC